MLHMGCSLSQQYDEVTELDRRRHSVGVFGTLQKYTGQQNCLHVGKHSNSRT